MNRAARYYTPRYQHSFPHRCLGCGSRTVTVAGRDGDDVPTGTLRAIFRQAGIDWRLR
jgi:hypothetical protein